MTSPGFSVTTMSLIALRSRCARREALDSTREETALTAFERRLRERGLPIGHPLRQRRSLRAFASPNALFKLSKLSVWWLRLGIAIERIKPGHPQQNGRSEPMHLNPAAKLQHPAAALRCLRSRVQRRTAERGARHEVPGYNGLPELTYPFPDRDVLVTACGRLCLHRKRINISTVLAGQRIGIKEVDDGIWLVSFMHYDPGYFDLEQKTLQPLDNPFGTR